MPAHWSLPSPVLNLTQTKAFLQVWTSQWAPLLVHPCPSGNTNFTKNCMAKQEKREEIVHLTLFSIACNRIKTRTQEIGKITPLTYKTNLRETRKCRSNNIKHSLIINPYFCPAVRKYGSGNLLVTFRTIAAQIWVQPYIELQVFTNSQVWVNLQHIQWHIFTNQKWKVKAFLFAK